MRSTLSRTMFALLLGLLPVQADDDAPTSRPTAQLPPLGKPAGAFGAPLDEKTERVSLGALAQAPEKWADKTILVEATIQDVCQKKGCWMVLVEGEANMRVKFKDYAFFVPRDAKGRRVLVQGTAKVEEISEEVARHYAEEGGNPDKAKEIHGPQKGLSFLASGAEVLGSFELPPAAQGTPGAVQALEARLGRLPVARTRLSDPITPQAALELLRRTPGARSREFAARTQVGEWFVFGLGGEDPFAEAWAVHQDGQQAEAVPPAEAADSDEPR